ncbi:MAG: hypothetical protein Q9168_007324 [Polycauliona sp. 1 TL-2023]
MRPYKYGKLCDLIPTVRNTAPSRRKASSSSLPKSPQTSFKRQDHHDWNKNQDSFRYTAGRFLFEEKDQMASRYVKFDTNALVDVAARSVASKSCVAVRKLSECQYNKGFLLTMDDGKRVVAKVPNPNAGRPHYGTASEVATMDFIRNILKIPIPEVYAWNSRAAENPVGAEFIIMEEARGVPLSHKWPDLRGDDKLGIIESIVAIEATLASISFNEFGSLYYTEDVDQSIHHNMLYTDAATGTPITNARFSIGPTTDRKTFDNDRGSVDFDRGPWATAEEYIDSIALREIQCINELKRLPRPLGIVNGPGLYRPTKDSKLSVLNDFLKVARYLLPADKQTWSACLWHNDLHDDNIFVNPKKPTEITCLIDWQSAHVAPLFTQAAHPSFLDFEGPKPVGPKAPSLPSDFDVMNEGQQKRAKSLLTQQSLYKAYEILSLQKNKTLYGSLRYQKGLGCQIIALAGNVLQDGEPLVKGQLMEIQRQWQELPAVRAQANPSSTCPLQYSSEARLAQEVDQRKWMQGLELMSQILESLGTVDKGWYGWVSPEDYPLFKSKLDDIRNDFLDDLSENSEDRAIWAEAWPFMD